MRHPTVIQIHPLAAAKPAEGQPCNGCGVCCAAEPCPIGMLVSRRRQGACAALVWVAGERQYRCGVVNDPQRYIQPRWLAAWLSRAARRLIAAGKGCDCDLSVESARSADQAIASSRSRAAAYSAARRSTS